MNSICVTFAFLHFKKIHNFLKNCFWSKNHPKFLYPKLILHNRLPCDTFIFFCSRQSPKMMKLQWEKSPSLKLTSSCDFSASIYKWHTINVLSLQSSNRYKCNIPSILMMFKQPLTIAKRLQMRFISRIFCSRYLPRSLLELYY